jgi:pimeloyl-ACP methyl ester carboxylesterase
VLLEEAIKPFERRSTAARMWRPGSSWMSADTGFNCTVPAPALPAVVLESGLGETGAYWGWISTALAPDTRVCVYDRAGRGWSDPASVAQDGVAVTTDLRTLLDRAHVPGPFVFVGHSSGAEYVRIFAGRYPEQVAGVVLLDAQPTEAFEGLPAYPAFYSAFRRISALLPSLARLGVGRHVPPRSCAA